MSKHAHIGSSLNDLLEEDGSRAVVEAAAVKRAIALQIADEMERLGMTKAELARRMHTSRVSVDRLLDASNGSVTLGTLHKVALALGRRLSVQLT
jgi:antitoxin HicB